MIPVLVISAGTCGLARGADSLVKTAKLFQKDKNLQSHFIIKVTGCHGFCEAEPNVVVILDGKKIFYQKLKADDIIKVIEKTVMQGSVIDRLLYTARDSQNPSVTFEDIPFYKKQNRILLGNNLDIDPTSIDDYCAIGGYQALGKAIGKFKPEEIIEVVKQAGLRGRGGAGFPTGKKWELCRNARAEYKYLICNADEGDPGAYMDRSLLEGNPHLVLEGMIIGGYAIGANEGIIYVRNEYPLAVENLRLALKQAYSKGYLGRNIQKSRFSFEIKMVRGAGAFVCGEETALLASVEGKVGRPRPRPPYPVERGLFGKPTVINNVETWANVSKIIMNGAEWFAGIGTATSKGTKIFSLVGKINNTGLVEVPMGIALREIVYGIGGGIPNNRQFKAVQTGGPSGGCIPAQYLDLPIDYESLTQAGSMMGSGGMIVMDEDTCMVDVAKYFLNFTQQESCGKCPPCRMGTKQMVKVLERITEGGGLETDIELLQMMGRNIKSTSLCGLGQTAPNPVLTTIQYFRDEYEAHIKQKRCPAHVCKALISYVIDRELCTGCVVCAKNCPSHAIAGEPKKTYTIDQEKCNRCGICVTVCPPKFNAIKKVSPVVQ